MQNSPFIEKTIANSNAIRFDCKVGRFRMRITILFVERLLRQLDIIVDWFRRCCRDRFSLGYKGDPKLALRTRAIYREKITQHCSRVGSCRLKYSICVILQIHNSPVIYKIIATRFVSEGGGSDSGIAKAVRTILFTERILRQLDIIVDWFRRFCRNWLLESLFQYL